MSIIEIRCHLMNYIKGTFNEKHLEIINQLKSEFDDYSEYEKIDILQELKFDFIVDYIKFSQLDH